MSEIPISPEIWKLAGEILTRKQLVVLELRERHGFSWNQIAIHMNTTKSNVREHHAAATRKIYDALEQAAPLLPPPSEMHVHRVGVAGTPRLQPTQPRPTSENGGPPSTSTSPKEPSPSSTSDPETRSSSASRTDSSAPRTPKTSSPQSKPSAPTMMSSSCQPTATSESSEPRSTTRRSEKTTTTDSP